MDDTPLAAQYTPSGDLMDLCHAHSTALQVFSTGQIQIEITIG
ncbi:MAG TPA: hypothetical protein V6C65_35740 [Allocoleopsis sp.]